MEALIMDKCNKKIYFCCENLYDELFLLESIIKMTKEACLKKEFSAIYYNLSDKERCILSEERNNYINMLSIALEKVDELKEINNNIEREVYCL